MSVSGDRRTGLVTMTMGWEEARDFGEWLIEQNDGLGPDLLRAAREAVGL